MGVMGGLVGGALLLVREGQKVLGLLGKEMTEELELRLQTMAAVEAAVQIALRALVETEQLR
jgi:hypothetical protein